MVNKKPIDTEKKDGHTGKTAVPVKVDFPWIQFQPNLDATKEKFKISDNVWQKVSTDPVFQVGFSIGWGVESIELQKVFKIWDETMVVLGRK